MIDLRSEDVKKGARVRFWSGAKQGEGRIGTISYDGVYEVGGTAVAYIAGVGAVALSHIESAQTELFGQGPDQV